MLKIILLLLTMSGLIPAAVAQTEQSQLKIGFVNAAKILDNAPQADLARKRLEQEFAPRDKILVDAQRSLRRLEDRLSNPTAEISDSERRSLERDLISQQRELKRIQDEFREDFNIRRNEELSKLQRQVYETIITVAKEQQFDIILNEGAVLYASDRADITVQVLERLSDQP